MKFHTLCAAALIACAAQASWAQAQVVVFGVADLSVRSASATGAVDDVSMQEGGNTSSRFGIRGTEDIGNGLKASFWLESAVNLTNGTSGSTSTDNKTTTTAGGFTWGRRATVGLQGNWGEVRMGRDFVPSFGNLSVQMHPFGTNGVGSSGHLFYPVPAGGTTPRTNVRASNSIAYHLPEFSGGFTGMLMGAIGGQPSGTPTSHDGNLAGLRLVYRSGPWRVVGASSKTDYATGDYTQSNLGVTYQWGAARLSYVWGENKVGVTKTVPQMVGAQWRVVPNGELRVAYTTLAATGVASDADHWAMGYVHDLSKRTALYANVAQIDNKGTGTRFNVGVAPITPGGSSSGAEVGMRHTF